MKKFLLSFLTISSLICSLMLPIHATENTTFASPENLVVERGPAQEYLGYSHTIYFNDSKTQYLKVNISCVKTLTGTGYFVSYIDGSGNCSATTNYGSVRIIGEGHSGSASSDTNETLVVTVAVKHTPPGGTERQYTFTFKIKRQSLMESSYTVN
ncbi:hypothetical protein [Traorella massiliensis]|jgi:hypothetical protein|uniref:hypothetical protein n=1 Tax=Traorella massiliensis TaxID=1903263 RepID=UPI0008F9370F|nr:hypothetical protein [Traorella massiliensis]